MSDIIGNKLKLAIFGSSHEPYVGTSVSGLPAGIKISKNNIKQALTLRKGIDDISIGGKENDDFKLISGEFNGYTSGDCLTIVMPNNNVRSADYDKDILRPSHVDYMANIKYEGYNDYCGDGYFSGRSTAPLVAIGAILRDILLSKNIVIGSFIKQVGEVNDISKEVFKEGLILTRNNPFPVYSLEIKEQMMKQIKQAKLEGGSIGGVLETIIMGIPVGIGEPYFNSIESVLSHLLFSIEGVKGVEFGLGINMPRLRGSKANDEIIYTNGRIETITNNYGGINGGFSSRIPIIVKTAFKPTPPILESQKSVNLKTKENCILQLKERYDACIVHRARFAVESLICLGLMDLITEEYGKQFFLKSEQ